MRTRYCRGKGRVYEGVNIAVVILSQVLFAASDMLARHNLAASGFSAAAFMTWWFGVYTLLRVFATFGQLYVFSQLQVGRAMTLFSAASLILVNLLGWLILKEQVSLPVYFGIVLAVIAILLVGWGAAASN